MLVHTACEALRSGHVLELRYDGYSRFVEVHDVGFTEDDNKRTSAGAAIQKLNWRGTVTNRSEIPRRCD
jgi:YD repeat-containing protein